MFRPFHLRTMWRLIGVLVTTVSLLWAFWLLTKAWPELAARSVEIRLAPLLLGLALSLAASYLTFEVFASLAKMLRISSMSHLELAHVYFTAQLLKHLPGRVWGIGYQWVAGRSAHSLGDWLLVNISHMLLSTYFALWCAGIALGFSRGAGWGIAAAVGGTVTFMIGWTLASSRIFGPLLAWLPARVRTLGRGVLDLVTTTSGSMRGRIFLFLCASWILYYASWALFGDSYPPIGTMGGVQLCAMYMLAWFVGYVSLLTPSGLGVRELVFVWLAKDFSGDAVALMAVLGRGSLLFVDIALGLAFARFVPRRS